MSNNIHFIAGAWHAGEGHPVQSIDPAKKQIIWQAYSASPNQIDLAVKAARVSFLAWSNLTFEQRLAYVTAFGELLTLHKQALAETIAQETGKPLWETATEVATMVGKITLSEKAYHQRTGTIENVMPIGKAFIRHKPHGVVAVFGPYNFPGHLPNGHIVPALLAGNTVVFKPSDLTPLVAEKTIQLWQQAGLPDGVLNLVQGEVETAKALASHSGLDGLFFTGSSRTGKILHEQFSGHPSKILALEMGGNNPLIVKDVEDVDATVHDIIQSAFITSGQRCTCVRRLFLAKGPAGDTILKRLLTVTANIKIGHYDAQEQPFMGAMISKKAASAMADAQQSLIALGATPLLNLKHLDTDSGFVSPGIIDVTDILAVLPDEEHFGPLLKVIRYDNFDQAIAEANNTSFGLSAGLLADNPDDYQYFYQRIRAGIVNWNRPITGASGAAPFGGIGQSGNHRASAYYAADYCSYPVSSVELEKVELPSKLTPGLVFKL